MLKMHRLLFHWILFLHMTLRELTSAKATPQKCLALGPALWHIVGKATPHVDASLCLSCSTSDSVPC